MSMVASVTLLTVSPFKEVANLRLVDALCDTEIDFAMSVKAILVVAPSRKESSAKLCLLQIRRVSKFIHGVCISAIC
jgi:hypothetical protein